VYSVQGYQSEGGGGLHQGSTICDSDGSYYSRSTGRFAYEAIVHR